MLLYAVCLLLLQDILSRSFISAAPITYDQRQSGDFNVDAKLENFLVIVATSGTTGLFNNHVEIVHIDKGDVTDKLSEKSQTHVKNLDQSDDLPVKEEISKAARPGISLKKQLSKKEEENASSVSEERNELGNNYQELVLLGGGIENCGPGRYRDKLGVCQDDKNFN